MVDVNTSIITNNRTLIYPELGILGIMWYGFGVRVGIMDYKICWDVVYKTLVLRDLVSWITPELH